MKKILIFIILNLLCFSSLFAKSPYTLKQIEEHLFTVFSIAIANGEKLNRFVEDPIYYAHLQSTPLDDKTMFFYDELNKHFKKISKITGIKFISASKVDDVGKWHWSKKLLEINLLFLFTNDFFGSLLNKKTQILFFGTTKEKIVKRKTKILKEKLQGKDLKVYGVSRDDVPVKSREHLKDGIDSLQFMLIEYNDVYEKYFDVLIRREINIRLMRNIKRAGTIDSIWGNLETIDLFSKKYMSINKTWHKIDEYLLAAYYSDKVENRMDLKKAVPIMAKYIYKEFKNNN